MSSHAAGSQTIPFDQFQRYHFIQNVVELITEGIRARILEVGAGSSPLRQLLADHLVIQLDDAPGVGGLDLRSSAFHLPFAKETFDLVVCTDVLEHVRPENRPAFLSEIHRVASRVVVLGFPQNSPLVREADRLLYEYIKSVKGFEYAFLREHLENGLPEPSEIRAILQPMAEEILEFQNANLYSWLPLMMSNFLLQGEDGFEEPLAIQNEIFNRYYNRESHQSPAYRTFFICLKKAVASYLNERLVELQNSKVSASNDYALAVVAIAQTFQKALERSKLQAADDKERIQSSLIESLSKLSTLQAVLDRKENELSQSQQQLRLRQGDLKAMETRLHGSDQRSDELQREVISLQSTLQQKTVESQTLHQHMIDQSKQIDNLQQYLNLFLSHPLYKIFKFFKGLFR